MVAQLAGKPWLGWLIFLVGTPSLLADEKNIFLEDIIPQ
jgi:hypothetical protein